MLALPGQLGGLGLINPIALAKEQRAASQLISAPLIDLIINQDHRSDNCHSVQQSIKRRIHHAKHTRQKKEAKNPPKESANPSPLLHGTLSGKKSVPLA